MKNMLLAGGSEQNANQEKHTHIKNVNFILGFS